MPAGIEQGPTGASHAERAVPEAKQDQSFEIHVVSQTGAGLTLMVKQWVKVRKIREAAERMWFGAEELRPSLLLLFEGIRLSDDVMLRKYNLKAGYVIDAVAVQLGC